MTPGEKDQSKRRKKTRTPGKSTFNEDSGKENLAFEDEDQRLVDEVCALRSVHPSIHSPTHTSIYPTDHSSILLLLSIFLLFTDSLNILSFLHFFIRLPFYSFLDGGLQVFKESKTKRRKSEKKVTSW